MGASNPDGYSGQGRAGTMQGSDPDDDAWSGLWYANGPDNSRKVQTKNLTEPRGVVAVTTPQHPRGGGLCQITGTGLP